MIGDDVGANDHGKHDVHDDDADNDSLVSAPTVMRLLRLAVLDIQDSQLEQPHGRSRACTWKEGLAGRRVSTVERDDDG